MKNRKGNQIAAYCKKHFPRDVSKQVSNDLDKIIKKQEKELKKSKRQIIYNLATNFDDSIPLINALRSL